MRPHREEIAGFVEGDVSVVADAEHLHVDSAGRSDGVVIGGAFGFDVLHQAGGDMDVLRGDIDAVKQVFHHKIVVALRMGMIEDPDIHPG